MKTPSATTWMFLITSVFPILPNLIVCDERSNNAKEKIANHSALIEGFELNTGETPIPPAVVNNDSYNLIEDVNALSAIEGSIAPDNGTLQLTTLLLYSNNTLMSRSSTSIQPQPAPTSSSGEAIYGDSTYGRQIKFANKCSKPVDLIIGYYPRYSSQLYIDGPWSFSAYESSYFALAESDGTRIYASNSFSYMYFYAESSDGVYEWSGNYPISVASLNLVIQMDIIYAASDGSFYVSLSCGSSSGGGSSPTTPSPTTPSPTTPLSPTTAPYPTTISTSVGRGFSTTSGAPGSTTPHGGKKSGKLLLVLTLNALLSIAFAIIFM